MQYDGGCGCGEYGGEESKQHGGCGGDDEYHMEQLGGGYGSEKNLFIRKTNYSPCTTDTLNWNNVSSVSEQVGGKKKSSKKKGSKKKIKKSSKTIKGKRKDKKRFKRKRARPDELHRLIGRQTDEIRKRVLEKVKELLKKILKPGKIDEVTALAYRAMLWNMVKEQHPEIESNFDKNMEMDKLTTIVNLKKIHKNKQDQLKEITEHIAKKLEKRSSDKKVSRIVSESPVMPGSETSPNLMKLDSTDNEKELSDTSPGGMSYGEELSDTSPDDMIYEGELSATSYSNSPNEFNSLTNYSETSYLQ